MVKGVCARYFFGPDAEGVREQAEEALAAFAGEKVRVDLNEIGRLLEWFASDGLFGAAPKAALVRELSGPSAKLQRALFALLDRLDPRKHLLVLAAPGQDGRAAWHRELLAHPKVQGVRVGPTHPEAFAQWLEATAKSHGLVLAPDVLDWAAERLCGMRAAARAFCERAVLYLGGEKRALTREEAAELLGERAPRSLDAWLHACMCRSPKAVRLARELLADGVAGVQMLAWLETRLEQMLLYLWHCARRSPQPLKAAGVFGAARQTLPEEAKHWRPKEVMQAMAAVEETERGIKGASALPEAVQIEALMMHFVRGRDAA